MGRDVSDDVKKLKREQLIAGELGKKLNMLELNICSDGMWTIANQFSIADIAIWRLMGCYLQVLWKAYRKTFLKVFKNQSSLLKCGG